MYREKKYSVQQYIENEYTGVEFKLYCVLASRTSRQKIYWSGSISTGPKKNDGHSTKWYIYIYINNNPQYRVIYFAGIFFLYIDWETGAISNFNRQFSTGQPDHHLTKSSGPTQILLVSDHRTSANFDPCEYIYTRLVYIIKLIKQFKNCVIYTNASQ